MALAVAELEVADPADAWRHAGFSIEAQLEAEAVARVGGVRIRLVGRERGIGIVGWGLSGLPTTGSYGELDGVPTVPSAPSAPSSAGPALATEHANGVTGIDHVVLLSPDLNRTVAALADARVNPRRERDAELGGRPMRQIFFRLGEVILEVIGSPDAAGEGPSSLWGITYVVADIDATATYFGDRTSPLKPAVQPGRRITTLRHHELGMSVRTAMISAPILGA